MLFVFLVQLSFLDGVKRVIIYQLAELFQDHWNYWRMGFYPTTCDGKTIPLLCRSESYQHKVYGFLIDDPWWTSQSVHWSIAIFYTAGFLQSSEKVQDRGDAMRHLVDCCNTGCFNVLCAWWWISFSEDEDAFYRFFPLLSVRFLASVGTPTNQPTPPASGGWVVIERCFKRKFLAAFVQVKMALTAPCLSYFTS